jgi:hypothetical protein
MRGHTGTGENSCNQPRRALQQAQLGEYQMSADFQYLWRELNQPRVEPLHKHGLRNDVKHSFRQIFHYFEHNTRPKVIDLSNLEDTDRNILAKHGISADYLLRNLKKTMADAYLDPLSFQLTAINEKAVYAVCPYTGKLLRSRHSLLASINTIFYRFSSLQIFYVVVAGLDGYKKNAIYFPQENLVVVSGKPWTFEIADLVELQARAVSNFIDCYRYLSDNNAAKMRTAACIGFFHFAHHLWNELPGIDRLLRANMLDSVDKFFVLREPLGKIDQIYPEIHPDQIERENTTGNIFKHLIKNNYFTIKLGSDLVSNELVNRVYGVAKENCRPKTLERVQNARRRHFPLLWVGVRVGSRMWINQVDGLAKLIDKLYAEFPRLGVVFDGFSMPADRSGEFDANQEYDKILCEENQIVNHIIQKLGQHPSANGIYNVVGSSIYEANIWAHGVDVYLSPYGTLQHKVAWFAKKPGIIHSNKTVLEASSKHLWAAFEYPVKPRFARHALVRDVHHNKEQPLIYRETSDWQKESGAGVLSMSKRHQRAPEFDNYELDWEALYSELVDLIRSSDTWGRMDTEIIAHLGKRKLKKILHTITNYINRAI